MKITSQISGFHGTKYHRLPLLEWRYFILWNADTFLLNHTDLYPKRL